MAEKPGWITFLVIAIGLHVETVVCDSPNKFEVSMLNHVKQEAHWQGMWFEEYFHEGSWRPISRIWYSNSHLMVVDRLQLVCPMMACAYGPNLIRFLLLTLEAIDECSKMQRDNNAQAGDCKENVGESLEWGKFVIVKLMRTLMYVDPTVNNDDDDNDKNRFFQTLLALEKFLTGQITVEFSGILPGGLVIYQMFGEVAQSLENLMLTTCRPNYQPFSITSTKSTYNSGAYPKGIYPFYTAKLNNYIGYIYGHLIQLGFHSNAITHNIRFDPSRRG